jgi:uncharacterized protein YyaL (SSP411 family)
MIDQSKKITIALAFTIALFGCNAKQGTELSVEKNLNFSVSQTEFMLEKALSAQKNPRTIENDHLRWTNKGFDWTEGFFPGTCWYLYEYTGDEKWKTGADSLQGLFENHRFLPRYHDLGFVFNCSYGNGLRLTGEEAYKDILIEAAETLSNRFNPNVGSIISWNVDKGWQSKRGWEFPVIIDNMMNLELLFEASKLSGDSKYKEVAIAHANTTLKNHFREDMSSYHVIDYDSITGKVRNKHTAQGYSHESSWARGQAWGLYGFTMCYRYTKNPEYLKAASKIADFIINNKKIPEDRIPYWDYDAPKIPDEPRDASAAATTASALLELSQYDNEGKKKYLKEAKAILKSLSSPAYQAVKGENHHFILKHSVGSIPHNNEIDVPLNYADYYYVEALLRLKETTSE